ncbi:MAG: phage shock protein PspC [Acidobacteriaceae bacterium]|nr:phage shock protein PspC [Acidobacteriaceae bacterium]
MYCTKCGNQLTPGSRFCSSCGTAYAPANPGTYPQSHPQQSQLVRPRNPRVIAGVCSGLALHYGWDITLIRLILVLCVLFAGTGVLAYVIAWIVIPEAPYALPQQTL